MNLKVFIINAFAKTSKGGNPAGVVLNADNLSVKDMKKTASILGLSETAFVMKSDCADFKVRFFTPNNEVDLCGHATIGTFSVLLNEGCISVGCYTQETKAGVLKVEVKADASIMMEQNKPKFYETVDKKEIAKSLNIKHSDIVEDLPIQIVSTGLRDIIIPIKNIKILDEIKPSIDQVAEISRKYDVGGYHIFTLDSSRKEDAYCRNFAPLYGINEESATGTSNGALACYLYKHKKFRNKDFVFEQGYAMNMQSEILVILNVVGDEITAVKVGGKALNLISKEINL
ncbi:PhzF family phenazine biosynthesis protein [Clostridiaceae bacterium M8S5]|nr:PhzF family phenazine biosynthesis protein [Clostridiaceae bacterium M8S5]